MADLGTYSEFAPTSFDRKGAFLEDDRQNWLVVPVSETRDSGPLDQSNFLVAKDILEECENKYQQDEAHEDETIYEEHSFNHWGPGWFSILIVKPGTPAEDAAREIADRLEDYPVLDEEDFSIREMDECQETWNLYSLADRFSLMIDAGLSIFAARHDYPTFDDQGYVQTRLLGH